MSGESSKKLIKQARDCIFEMSRALQAVTMYGTAHPSAKGGAEAWCRSLGPLMRGRGTFTLSTDGRAAFINSKPFASTNPNILELFQRMHASRAGKLEILAGLRVDEALVLLEFLSRADSEHIVSHEHSLPAWLEQQKLRHIRASELHLKEVKEGDRVISGDKLRPSHTKDRTDQTVHQPVTEGEAANLAQRFQEALSEGAEETLTPEVRDEVVDQIRGSTSDAKGDIAAAVAAAASHPEQLAELILKASIVEQELGGRDKQPVSGDVIVCLRRAVDPLQNAPVARSKEGWADISRTVAAITECIVGRITTVAGGTDTDADAVRECALTIQRELEGAALRHEYGERRSALMEADRRVRHFFGLERDDPI